MCGRFAQYESRDQYFDALGLTPDDILLIPNPSGVTTLRPELPYSCFIILTPTIT